VGRAAAALVHAPYPYEASMASVVIGTVGGALAALAIAALMWRGHRAGRRVAMPRAVVLAWLVP